MADFPVVKTVAVPNVTPVMAKHINNLEDKVGITGSADTASLDYQVTDVRTQFDVDHDLAGAGHHKLGTWQIGAVPVTSSGTELNKLDGAGVNVTPANLNSLVDGADIGTVLHRHDSYIATVNNSLTTAATPYPNLNASSQTDGFLCFWMDSSISTLHVLGRAKASGDINLKVRLTLTGAVFSTVNNVAWSNNAAAITALTWGGAGGPFAWPTNPANSSPAWPADDKFYWGGTSNIAEIWYSLGSSGDSVGLVLTGWSSTTQITAEIIAVSGNQGLDRIMLGTMSVAAGLGNIGQKVIFNLAGKLIELD